MNPNWKLKALAAGVLAIAIAGCSTTKAPATKPDLNQPQTQTDTSAQDKGAQTSAGDTSAADLQAQQLADAKARAEREAAEKANQLTAQLGIRTFYFDYDSSSLQSSDLDALKAHAAYLAKNPSARISVQGHADERGTREYNMALGERRAKAVAAFLSSNGAKSSQLSTVSYGKEKPAVEGHDDASWAKNRRVELDYTAAKP